MEFIGGRGESAPFCILTVLFHYTSTQEASQDKACLGKEGGREWPKKNNSSLRARHNLLWSFRGVQHILSLYLMRLPLYACEVTKSTRKGVKLFRRKNEIFLPVVGAGGENTDERRARQFALFRQSIYCWRLKE